MCLSQLFLVSLWLAFLTTTCITPIIASTASSGDRNGSLPGYHADLPVVVGGSFNGTNYTVNMWVTTARISNQLFVVSINITFARALDYAWIMDLSYGDGHVQPSIAARTVVNGSALLVSPVHNYTQGDYMAVANVSACLRPCLKYQLVVRPFIQFSIDAVLTSVVIVADPYLATNTQALFRAVVTPSTALRTLLQYQWTVDGVNATQPAYNTFPFVFASAGYANVSVIVNNSRNLISNSSFFIVQDAISGLEIGAQSEASPGQPIVFKATIASGTQPSYQWDFGDGNITTGGATITHTYLAAARYDVSVAASNYVSNEQIDQIIFVSTSSGTSQATYAIIITICSAGGLIFVVVLMVVGYRIWARRRGNVEKADFDFTRQRLLANEQEPRCCSCFQSSDPGVPRDSASRTYGSINEPLRAYTD